MLICIGLQGISELLHKDVLHVLLITLQDSSSKGEDFICGKYNGDEQQVEAILVSHNLTLCVWLLWTNTYIYACSASGGTVSASLYQHR